MPTVQSKKESLDSRTQFKVPQGENDLYHVQLERVEFNRTTGERLSKPYIQAFAAKDFERYMKRSLEQQGYTLTILHDPNAKVSTKAEGKPTEAAPEAVNE